MKRTLKIISGGQTGADRAALDAALDAGVPCGGWCPAGRLAEDGVIPDRYPLTPLPAGGYEQRTRQNVIDSDATVIFCLGPLSGGSETTRLASAEAARPLLVIDPANLTPSAAAAQLLQFLDRNRVRVLNIAGPRASDQPEIGPFVYATLRAVFAATS